MCFFYDDYEGPQVYNETLPVARKTHKCSECGGSIERGSRYKRVFGVWDGDAETFRICRLCAYQVERIALKEHQEGCSGSEMYPALGCLYQHFWGYFDEKEEPPESWDFEQLWRVKHEHTQNA